MPLFGKKSWRSEQFTSTEDEMEQKPKAIMKPWVDAFNKMREASENYKFSLPQYLDAWEELIESADWISKSKETYVEAIATCIKLMPVSRRNPQPFCGKNIFFFLQKIYGNIYDKLITRAEAASCLDEAEQKFSLSYFWAHGYWTAVRFWEEKILMKSGTPYETIYIRLAAIFRQQFSNPYYQLVEDHLHFKEWASRVNLDNTIVEEINALVSQTNIELKKIEKYYPNPEDPLNKDYQTQHHIFLERWVSKLLRKAIRRSIIFILCEEEIAQDRQSICAYQIYLCALAKSTMPDIEGVQDRIFSIIKQALRFANRGCDGLLARFHEHAFLIAGQLLSLGQFEELMQVALDKHALHKVTDNKSADLWFFTRRGVVAGAANMMNERYLYCEINGDYEPLFAPLSMKKYFQSNDPSPLAGPFSVYLQIKIIELLMVVLKVWKKTGKRQWVDIYRTWDKILGSNKNPINAYAHLQFVKECSNQIYLPAAFEKAKESFRSVPNSPIARQLVLQTLSDSLKNDIHNACAMKQINNSEYFGFRQAYFSLMYNEEYNPTGLPLPLEEYNYLATSVFSQEVESESSSTYEDAASLASSASLSGEGLDSVLNQAREQRGQEEREGLASVSEYHLSFDHTPLTILVLKNLPKELANDEKLRALLNPFGNIKSLTVKDNTGSVEFYKPRDCSKVHKKWLDGFLLRGTGTLAYTKRRSYVPRSPLYSPKEKLPKVDPKLFKKPPAKVLLVGSKGFKEKKRAPVSSRGVPKFQVRSDSAPGRAAAASTQGKTTDPRTSQSASKAEDFVLQYHLSQVENFEVGPSQDSEIEMRNLKIMEAAKSNLRTESAPGRTEEATEEIKQTDPRISHSASQVEGSSPVFLPLLAPLNSTQV